MKKTYLLILEFEAEVSERFTGNFKEEGKYLETLLTELLKNGKKILDIYRLWLMSDLGCDHHIYEIDEGFANLKSQDEYKIIKPVIESLPAAAREYFKKILETDEEDKSRYFECLFEQFGTLRMKRANFLEKGK